MFARSWESLALRHGCVETWTFGGRDGWDIVKRSFQEAQITSWEYIQSPKDSVSYEELLD